MIKLVCFLGNFGKEYEKTRHNVAWQFCNFLELSLDWKEKFSGHYAFDGKVYYLKPDTYMNNSGVSVQEMAQFFKITVDEILIVHDELELPFGVISLKYSGGLGGHNGLRSVKTMLGTADFWRLRFGISKPENQNIADYVLSRFSKDEEKVLPKIFSGATEVFQKILQAETQSEKDGLIKEWGKKWLVVSSE